MFQEQLDKKKYVRDICKAFWKCYDNIIWWVIDLASS